MTTMPRGALPSLVFILILLTAGGCNKAKNDSQPIPLGPGLGGPGGPGDSGGTPSTIKQVMSKIGGRGPQALNMAIGKELGQEPPPWETLQPQTKEYAELAASLGKEQPRKGSAESWQNFTTSFAAAAEELKLAADAKDQAKAKDAHKKLMNSCNDCHKEHRGGPMRPGG
jgi:hypothetical protein